MKWLYDGHKIKDKGYTDKGRAMHVSRVSILINIVLTGGKLAAGIIAHSNAMISDAVHSASDVFSTLIVMAGVSMASKQPDKEHPFGHDRMECVAALFLSLILFAMGVGIGAGAVKTIFWSYGEAAVPGILAMAAAVASIGVKEWMYRYTKRAAADTRSGALMADAWHHRSDALSSIGALVGIGGARMGLPFMDPAASFVICIFIGKAAIDVLKDSLNKMVDKACDEEMSASIIVTASAPEGVERVEGLKTRLFGSRLYVEIEIGADRNLNLEQVHDIAKHVHDAVEQGFPQVKHCLVQVNPVLGEEGNV